MMKSFDLLISFSLLRTFTLGVALSFALISCQKQEIEEDLSNYSVNSSEGQDPTEDPCNQGTLVSIGSWNVLPATEYPTYDLAIKFNYPAFELSMPCHCHSTKVQIQLSINESDLDYLGSTFEPGPSPPVHEIYNSNPFGGGTGKTTIYNFTLYADDGNILLFKFDDHFDPFDSDPVTIVNAVKGICLVDNIHDPHDNH